MNTMLALYEIKYNILLSHVLVRCDMTYCVGLCKRWFRRLSLRGS